MPPRLCKNVPIYTYSETDKCFISLGRIDVDGVTIVASGKDVTDKYSVPYGSFLGKDGKITLEFKLSLKSRIKWYWTFWIRHHFVKIVGTIRSKIANFGVKKA